MSALKGILAMYIVFLKCDLETSECNALILCCFLLYKRNITSNVDITYRDTEKTLSQSCIIWFLHINCLISRFILSSEEIFQNTNTTTSLPLSEVPYLLITFSITTKLLCMTYTTSKLQPQFLQLPHIFLYLQPSLHVLFSSPGRTFLLFMFKK